MLGVENLKEIKGNLPVEAEDFVNFDSELATTEDIQSASDITMGGNVTEVIEESDNDEGDDAGYVITYTYMLQYEMVNVIT